MMTISFRSAKQRLSVKEAISPWSPFPVVFRSPWAPLRSWLQKGVSVEVIDPRSLVPMDWEAILTSVTKDRALVVAVDVAHRTCSVASEITSTVAERGFWDLKGPVMRVTTPDNFDSNQNQVRLWNGPCIPRGIALSLR